MAVRTYLDISTAHITQEDAEQLADEARTEHLIGAPVLSVKASDGGVDFWVTATFEPHGDVTEELMRDDGWSNAMITVMKLARDLDVDWIHIDPDGDHVGALPTFDW